MDRVELMKQNLRKWVKQIDYIRNKLQRISGFVHSNSMRLFDNHLKKTRDHFESALTTPEGWQSYASITKSERLTNSIIIGYRLEVFTLEVRFEFLAIRHENAFFGFYNPEAFKLFGLTPELVYDKGLSGGGKIPAYDAVRSAIQNDPSLILREREKVTEYINKGCQTSVFKRTGDPFPIDLTIPEGY